MATGKSDVVIVGVGAAGGIQAAELGQHLAVVES